MGDQNPTSEMETLQRILAERSRPFDPGRIDELAVAARKFRDRAVEERQKRERKQLLLLACVSAAVGVLGVGWHWFR